MPTLLTTTGYGNTGSSAVTNILEEFRSVKGFGSVEFSFAHESDGIADLENSLLEGHRLKTDLAIKRFLKLTRNLSFENHYIKYFNGKYEELTKEYIDSIIPCKWNGWWHRVDETEYISNKQRKRISILYELYPLYLNDNTSYELYEPDNWRPTYCPLSKEYYANLHGIEKKNDFLEKTRNYTEKLLAEACIKDSNYRYVLLDQAVPPISFSQYMRYFNLPKVIIVDRDPRDLYIMTKVFWGSGYVPTIDIHQYIKWYLQTRQSRKIELDDSKKIETGEVLFTRFESLVYEYDDSIKKIMNYTGLSENEHTNKLKYFNPELSIGNTQVFVDYPELQKNINLIEQHLGEYCYNFPCRKQKKEVKHIYLDEINREFDKQKTERKLLKETKKYVFKKAYKFTKFYIDIHTFNKKRNVFSLLKLCVKLVLFPLEILIYIIIL